MTNTPPPVKPHSAMPYVWALVILVLIGALFIVGILFLRPQIDPLVLIAAVSVSAGVIFGQVVSIMKTQETHATVNDASTEKVAFAEASAFARGELAGAEKEQARVAKQVLITAATATALPAAAEPTPVVVANAAPVAVTETKGKP